LMYAIFVTAKPNTTVTISAEVNSAGAEADHSRSCTVTLRPNGKLLRSH